MSDADWNAAWTYFQQQAGPTWGGVVNELAGYASYAASVSDPAFISEATVFGYAVDACLCKADASAPGYLYLTDTNHPLSGAEVILSNTTTGNSSGSVSNPDGSFTVFGLAAGTYNVQVDGYLLPNAVQVTVPATGAATGLSIVVSKGGSISGTVRTQINNSDISGTTVTATNTSDQTLYPVTTDASGNYDITDLPEGTYDLTVGGDPWETQYLSGIQISNGSTVSAENFTLAAGASVNGQVVVNGTPVADALCRLDRLRWEYRQHDDRYQRPLHVQWIRPGAYTENVSAEGYARSSAPVTLVSGTTTTAASVSLSPGNTLAVTLLGPSSNVPTNGIVELDQAGQLVAISYVQRTGASRLFRSQRRNLPTPNVGRRLGEHDRHREPLGRGNRNINYQLTVGCLVRGTVTDGNLAPISNMLLNLSGTDTSGNPIVSEAITGSDGTYQFPNLQPGTYTVTVGNDEGIDLQDTTLTAGAPDSTLNFTVAGAVIRERSSAPAARHRSGWPR